MVFQVAGHVHADEHHLKAAHKIARHQQLKAGVFEGFFQSLANGLVTFDLTGGIQGGLAQAQSQGDDQHGCCGQDDQRGLPAHLADQQPFDRHHQKLTKTACRSRHTHGPGAALGRHITANHAINHRVSRARLRGANDHPGEQGKHPRIGGPGHAQQADAIDQGPQGNDPESPKPVGHHARKNAHETP